MTLLSRLENAAQGSRELDRRIWLAVVEKPQPGDKLDKDMERNRWPHYTTDLSAAVALVERVLPEYRLVLTKGRDFTWFAEVGWQTGNSKSPALALCIALLKALEAKEPSA